MLFCQVPYITVTVDKYSIRAQPSTLEQDPYCSNVRHRMYQTNTYFLSFSPDTIIRDDSLSPIQSIIYLGYSEFVCVFCSEY
mmetsp:Transcript_6330/g.13554  ORF Transcript_6330/g.13554 Transcript_6330/m.13554 type:complete len:82 (-) Transcript_6330:423-668(-)